MLRVQDLPGLEAKQSLATRRLPVSPQTSPV